MNQFAFSPENLIQRNFIASHLNSKYLLSSPNEVLLAKGKAMAVSVAVSEAAEVKKVIKTALMSREGLASAA